MNTSARFSAIRSTIWLVTCLALPLSFVLAAEGPQPPASSERQSRPNWTITLLYGGGTPNDCGPMGHCTATFTSNGHVKIESRGRQGVSGRPSDLVLYQNDSLSPELVQVFSKAADAALKEKPRVRPGEHSDLHFLYMDRTSATNSHVYHGELDEFRDAPPAMRKFVALMNDLLPSAERVPLSKK